MEELKVLTNIRATQSIRTLTEINLPSRIVDVNKNEIIECKDWNFWTLSYVWKTLKDEEIWDIGNRPYPANKSKWKVTAFNKNEWNETRRLLKANNIDKVWVDALCIDQSSILEKEQEISKMASIYKSSYGCIIFPEGLGKECNILKFSKRESSWFSRVWTVQEGILPNKLIVYFGYGDDEFTDLKNIFKIQDKNDKTYKYQDIVPELGIEDIAPYELLRITAKRNATKNEDKIYSLISILGLNQIKLEYDIGERNAAIKIFQSMTIDQRAQWICVDWVSGEFPDGMSCVPMLKSNYHGYNIDITSNIKIRTILSLVDFQGFDGTWITGKWFEVYANNNYKDNGKNIIPSEILLHEKKCKGTCIEKKIENCFKKCFGVCDYNGKIVCIILGTSESLCKGDNVLLLCSHKGTVLKKVGLATTNYKPLDSEIGKWLIA